MVFSLCQRIYLRETGRSLPNFCIIKISFIFSPITDTWYILIKKITLHTVKANHHPFKNSPHRLRVLFTCLVRPFVNNLLLLHLLSTNPPSILLLLLLHPLKPAGVKEQRSIYSYVRHINIRWDFWEIIY